MAGNTLDLGRVRLVHKGVYGSGTAYEFFDCVTYNGSSYVCTASGGSPAGTLPTDTSKWALMAQKGNTGAKGDKGDTGDTGAKGATGAKGVSFAVKGAWASGTAYVNNAAQIDVVTYNGSSYACVKSHTSSSSILPTNDTYWTLIAQKGATGATGKQGEKGDKGDKGDTGATGPQGPAGPQATTLSNMKEINGSSLVVKNGGSSSSGRAELRFTGTSEQLPTILHLQQFT